MRQHGAQNQSPNNVVMNDPENEHFFFLRLRNETAMDRPRAKVAGYASIEYVPRIGFLQYTAELTEIRHGVTDHGLLIGQFDLQNSFQILLPIEFRDLFP